MSTGTSGRTGRRPGPGSSRDALLHAARTQFTLHGYKGATVRAIATTAGVDPGLIRHFFGDKEGLFVASMELPPEAVRSLLDVFTGPVESWGECLTRTYLSLWEDPATGAPLRATMVSALTNDQARDRLRDFLVSAVLEGAYPGLPVDDRGFRLGLAFSHLFGTSLARYILQVAPLADRSTADMVATLAPTIQAYLTGPLPSPARQPGPRPAQESLGHARPPRRDRRP